MKSYWMLIVGMMLVTYIPRLIPLIILSKKPLPSRIQRLLAYIPYTALSALIVKGLLQATGGSYLISVLGIGVAALCAWFKGGMVVSVLASIGITFLMLNLC